MEFFGDAALHTKIIKGILRRHKTMPINDIKKYFNVHRIIKIQALAYDAIADKIQDSVP